MSTRVAASACTQTPFKAVSREAIAQRLPTRPDTAKSRMYYTLQALKGEGLNLRNLHLFLKWFFTRLLLRSVFSPDPPAENEKVKLLRREVLVQCGGRAATFSANNQPDTQRTEPKALWSFGGMKETTETPQTHFWGSHFLFPLAKISLKRSSNTVAQFWLHYKWCHCLHSPLYRYTIPESSVKKIWEHIIQLLSCLTPPIKLIHETAGCDFNPIFLSSLTCLHCSLWDKPILDVKQSKILLDFSSKGQRGGLHQCLLHVGSHVHFLKIKCSAKTGLA